MREREGNGGGDPKVVALRSAVSRLRRELAAHPREFAERGIAEEELAALGAMAFGGTAEPARLLRSLLAVAGALGSVSALAAPLAALREAVRAFTETGQGR
ncbi:DUF5955 family protein [Streptomyces bambusae]|uniref:DUF5955 family protein n=1 Tax=Streptomyces bambusae TaxID=1550616 RepID=UPI001CFF986A|nr:DUF5955 family protein [Streptomyces bambusae]MCB5169555.1 DUF5955 family protein [Streptomyces bambusae]